MNLYAFIQARWGTGAANAAVIVLRAVLIATVVILSDRSPQPFSYLRM